jgi:hypothetical protein
MTSATADGEACCRARAGGAAAIQNFPTIQRIAAARREKVTVPMLEAFLAGAQP